MSQKYYFVCRNCGHKIDSFKQWFKLGQKCPECGKNFVDTKYNTSIDKLKELIFTKQEVKSLWHYLDFLPLDDAKNIVSAGEGVPQINRWEFLEEVAQKEFSTNCKVYVMRHNTGNATRTFKDIAGTLAASVLKECGINEYAVASTGNTANAFSHYLAMAGISLYVFMPEDAVKENIASVSSYGQKAVICKGDYAFAKKIAGEFTAKNNILMTIGNTDPLRVEAKKTWVYEWLRQVHETPTVYFQALSGGTGPIAVEKAFDEIEPLNIIFRRPRYISVQPSLCDPMTQAWEKAKANKFPEGWQNDYPKFQNPKTKVQTLATGVPGTYPIIADITKRTHGEIISFDESRLVDIARLITFKTGEKIGPASAVAMGGFFDALKKGLIANGEIVMINMGEGIDRASFFLQEYVYNEDRVSSADEIRTFNRQQLEFRLWRKILE
ncbi:MAG: pyridoxal-phosphate dependent enzyme [Bacteroidales bacterium]|nr:pyridoxal-phosphate dependent enzyme [Bacteroidales bacterium]